MSGVRSRVRISHLRVDGLILKITRKKIRNLYIRVANGEIKVSAPFFLSDERIAIFARSRLGWIKEKLAANPAPAPLEDGAPIPVWGRSIPLALHSFARINAVKSDSARLHIYCREGAERETIEALIASWHKKILRDPAERLLEMWRDRMGIDPPLELQIRKMRSRWGACMPNKRKITLNSALARYTPSCLEFVVVHELSHMLVPNHGPEFIRTLDRWLPDWRERKASLEREASGALNRR
ncbi:MAG: M48 family metallopeptidase [Desulfovibrio sp.]|nr:M48 family metallopeptidase [Desulfovibrio sp.]